MPSKITINLLLEELDVYGLFYNNHGVANTFAGYNQHVLKRQVVGTVMYSPKQQLVQCFISLTRAVRPINCRHLSHDYKLHEYQIVVNDHTGS